ncbi:MAG TPA: PH domain-containing protein [Acidimicrobiales bacterium]|nr:PH domain-containing protein [Acidimicrobiales bacterium]
MPYPRKLLNDGEDVVLDLHPHWWFFVRPTLAFVASVVLGIVVGPNVDNTGVRLALLGLMAVTALWWLFRYLKWRTTNFAITTDRLVFRSGVLAKNGREVPLDRLNDISFHQSLFERMIGAGDLMIESAGERGQEAFTDIPHPSRVQNSIYAEVERHQTRRAGGSRELSIPEQIEKLDELRQRGVVTQAEFDAKKSQLLDRL